MLQRIQEEYRNFRLNLQYSQASRKNLAVVLGALLVCVVAAASGFLFSSSFSPILTALGVGGLLLLAVGLGRPWYVLYAAIFIIFVPADFISADIQSYLNRGMTVFVFAVWAFDLFVNRKKVYLPLPAIFMVIFLAWALLSLTWAPDFAEALTILQRYFLRFLLFLFLTVNLIDTRRKLNGLMNVLALIGFLIILAGMGQLFIDGYTPGTRFTVLGMNENSVGVLLVIAMLGVLWWASQPSDRYGGLKKLAAVIYIFCTIVLVAISGSRGSAISMVATLLILLFWKSTRFWGYVALAIVIMGLILAPFLFLTTMDRFMAEGYSGDTALGGREGLWQAAWLMIRDHPLTGVGIGNAYFQMKKYLSDVSVPTYMMPVQVWGAESASPHNPILAIWADVGAVGLLLYLGMFLSAFYLFIRSYLRGRHGSLQLYYGLLIAVFCGYFLSWVKGGGMESDHSFFMMMAFLVMPGMLEKSVSNDGLASDSR